MAELRDKLLTYWRSNETVLRSLTGVTLRVTGTMFSSYMLASLVATALIGFFAGPAIDQPKKSKSAAARPDIRKSLNYREVRKVVVKRNIFNSAGELPDESEATATETTAGGEFNANDKCVKSKLPIQLVGIIFSNNPENSLATVREKGYREADIYRAGDAIIGQEQAVIHAVETDRLVVNNNGVKECLEVSKKKSRSFSSSPSLGPSEPVKSEDPDSEDLATIQLQSSFVEESLGPGFAKILESGRLVPYNRDGSMIGFKLIGVKSKSLWKKVGLNSGDVITSVNGLSMAQPDKGFALYEALQNERQIRVDFLKKGKAPSNINVEIK